ncbi:hypothetical protein SO802_005152 [Lithocarpus litseifolius]|uniref:Carbohydrate kinase PfkB domain-containing protein n=1 Tax=Lithocarpus litseifolius TaxID=425828 RepID=A0AAW2DKL0_9ROSI
MLDDSLFVEIEIGQSVVVDDPEGPFTVKAFDTNHCPEAGMQVQDIEIIEQKPNIWLPLWPSPEEALDHIKSIWDKANLIKVCDVELEFLTGSNKIDDESAMSLWHPNLKLLVILGDLGCRYYTKIFHEVVGEPSHGHILGMGIGIKAKDVYGLTSSGKGCSKCYTEDFTKEKEDLEVRLREEMDSKLAKVVEKFAQKLQLMGIP